MYTCPGFTETRLSLIVVLLSADYPSKRWCGLE